MSKTIESLRRFPTKEEILFQDHIVDTYFYKKTRRKKNKAAKSSLKRMLALAMSAAAAGIVLALAFLFFQERYVNFLKERVINSKVIAIYKNGSVNKDVVRKTEFRGSAKAKSSVTRDFITLDNPKKYSWADMAISFRFPVDLSERDIIISMKGRTGGERMDLILKDNANRSARIRDIYMTSAWRTDTMDLKNIKDDADLGRITQLRIESGYVGESTDKMDSPIDLTVYIKDIQFSKRGKAK